MSSATAASSVHVAALGDCYARLFGVNCETWQEPDTPLPRDHTQIERYITALPFAIGRARSADKSIGLLDDDASWLLVSGGVVSRKHAIISFDEAAGSYKITCHSPNGIDVNRESDCLRGGDGEASARTFTPAFPTPPPSSW